MAPKIEPLDEQQWSSALFAAQDGGIRNDNVLYYFAKSPFFDPMSNNATLWTQAMHNGKWEFLRTRATFEAELRRINGLEYVVTEAPAEDGPVGGTGVYVISKQNRKIRHGEEDLIEVLDTYFVIGENIYQAPTLYDVLMGRLASISESLTKCIHGANEEMVWHPSKGHYYEPPAPTAQQKRARALEPKEATPMPDGQASHETDPAAQKTNKNKPNGRFAEEVFMTHMRYGGEYVDENPVVGRPGEFHFSNTGRSLNVPKPGPGPGKPPGPLKIDLPALDTNSPLAKDTKGEKTPKSAAGPKPKRRKSKGGTATPS